DAQHRAPFGLQSFVQNTWRFGLDRILAGVTLSADSGGWLDRTLPLDDVGSGQIDLAGRFAEYVDRLAAVTDRLVGVHPLAHWLSALTDGIEALTAVSMADSWQPAQAQRELGAMATDTTAPGELRLADIRALLRGRLAGRPTRANFRTGSLTVCSMVPMRSVPHRVVCLLGLDDGAFPRGAGRDGDDLLARDPLVGERDPRAEDRQLMLDALCAAKDAVVITYTGSDVYTGQPRPPAVPLGELLDALDLTAVAAEGRVQEAITIHHPLQPFDVRNVAVGALVPGEPFSFDPSAAAGARAMIQDRVPPLDWRTVRLPALDAASLGEGSLGEGSLGEETLGLGGVGAAAAEVRLDDLLTFFRSPARGFFKQRLEVDLPFEEKPLSDGLHVEIDSLEQWAVGERVLADLLAGIGPEEAKQREWRRGFLPPGQLGWRQLRGIVDQAVPLAREALGLRERAAYAVDVDVDLGGGRRLSGTVGEIYRGRLVPVSFSRLGPAHRLRSWINLLAVTAQDPDHNYTAHTIGRPGNRQETVAISRLGPIDDRSAAAHLRDLVTLYDEGRRRPLPLPVKSSCAYAEYRRSEASVGESLKAASKRWQDDRFKGEQSDAENVRLYGRRASLPGTRKADWGDLDIPREPDESAPFGALAMRLWRPLLEAENQPW
ncbi:MAG: exodeoxyribonuclease V subunit gamma, partial [Nocardioides sp.]